MLVECLVSMLLLSAGALALVASTRATTLLGDDAVLVARAQAQASEWAELARLQLACGSAPMPLRAAPRVAGSASNVAGAGVVRDRYAATLALSPFARALAPTATGVLTLSSGRPCE